MKNRLFAVRGATQVASDAKQSIIEAVVELYQKTCNANDLSPEKMVSIQFTVTPDLHSLNPATALRTVEGMASVPLFCMQEPVVDNMLPRAVRILIHYYATTDHRQIPVYLRGAAELRPDLVPN